MFALLEAKLETKLSNIHKSSLRGEHKIAIYSRYVLPSLRFYKSVRHIHKIHQEKLDTIVRKYLKSWLRIPSRGATDASRFHPNTKHHQTCTLDSRIERESAWTKKFSTIVAVDSVFQENIKQQRIKIPGENVDNKMKQTMIKEALKKVMKNSIKDETLFLWNTMIGK